MNQRYRIAEQAGACLHDPRDTAKVRHDLLTLVRQRLFAIALGYEDNDDDALVHDPEVVFLDEPASGLDVPSTRALRELIPTIKRQGATVFLTTHNLQEAEALSQRVLILIEGRVAAQGAPEEIRQRVQRRNLLTATCSPEIEAARLRRACPAVLILSLYVKDPGTYLIIAPGVVAMTPLFGNTSMAAIVVTFEKRAGIFQRLLLALLSMSSMIPGKAASASAYGLATALALALGLNLALGIPLVNPLIFGAGLLLGAGCFSLLGLTAAVVVREVFAAMTLMNFFRFPILFISGVFMPLSQLPPWLKPLSLASPLSYLVELLHLGVTGRSEFPTPSIPLLAGLALLFASWLLAVALFRRRASECCSVSSRP